MAEEKKEAGKRNEENLAIVQIRGTVGFRQTVKDTLHMLGLKKKHQCVIRPANPSTIGMIKKVAHAVTWGEVDAETEQALRKKKKEGAIGLHPPRGGFERKGIKIPFKTGGALGYRGKEINTLVKRMI